jgi:hypothetical protein
MKMREPIAGLHFFFGLAARVHAKLIMQPGAQGEIPEFAVGAYCVGGIAEAGVARSQLHVDAEARKYAVRAADEYAVTQTTAASAATCHRCNALEMRIVEYAPNSCSRIVVCTVVMTHVGCKNGYLVERVALEKEVIVEGAIGTSAGKCGAGIAHSRLYKIEVVGDINAAHAMNIKVLVGVVVKIWAPGHHAGANTCLDLGECGEWSQ